MNKRFIETKERSIYLLLTENEKDEKQKQLIQLMDSVRCAEKELAIIQLEKKELIKTAKETVNHLSRVLFDGKELKKIKCDVYIDYDKKEKQYFYNGDLVDSFQANEDDLQIKIPIQISEVKEDSIFGLKPIEDGYLSELQEVG